MAAKDISFVGPVGAYNQIGVSGYKPTIQHDPINALMKVTVDFAKVSAEIKRSRVKDNTATLGIEAGDKYAVAILPKGVTLGKMKSCVLRPESTASAKANGNGVAVGDTQSASRYLAIGAAGPKTGAGVGSVVSSATADFAYDSAADALVMSPAAAVDASNDLPVDGCIEVVFNLVSTLPELNATKAE
jgi:hypothetical protein